MRRGTPTSHDTRAQPVNLVRPMQPNNQPETGLTLDHGAGCTVRLPL